MERERDIEARLRRGIGRLGGLALKFSSPGEAGVPDRLVLLPGGRVCFVELKTVRGRLSPLQRWQQERLRALGCRVVTLRGREDAEAFLKEVTQDEVHTTALSEKSH